MLKSSFRLFSLVTKNSIFTPALNKHCLLINNNLFGFCKTEKHQTNEKHRHEELKEKHKHKQEADEGKEEEKVETPQPEEPQSHHHESKY